MSETTVLVTGGAGFIGSHCVVELLKAKYRVIVLDDYSNSSAAALAAAERLGEGKLTAIYPGDLRDVQLLDRVFKEHSVDVVLHLAAKKAVGESVREPLLYYNNNVGGTISLLEAMKRANVKSLVFSSSATVYNAESAMPVTESSPLGAINPYGHTKQMMETILRDVAAADSDWKIYLLRYFNPCGAHPSGELGEDPLGAPNNLMPFVAQVAVGRREKVAVFGQDYDTPDGTGVRDYIHVVDLALGHVAALKTMKPGCDAVNLGRGQGYSVLECIKGMEKACGHAIAHEFTARRAGDASTLFADTAKAKQLFGWTAQFDLDTMCKDLWCWQSKNPQGFRGTK